MITQQKVSFALAEDTRQAERGKELEPGFEPLGIERIDELEPALGVAQGARLWIPTIAEPCENEMLQHHGGSRALPHDSADKAVVWKPIIAKSAGPIKDDDPPRLVMQNQMSKAKAGIPQDPGLVFVANSVAKPCANWCARRVSNPRPPV